MSVTCDCSVSVNEIIVRGLNGSGWFCRNSFEVTIGDSSVTGGSARPLSVTRSVGFASADSTLAVPRTVIASM